MPAKSLRILVAPDKFKGTLTAKAAARAIRDGWRTARPYDKIEMFPISDGGDGFGSLISENIRAVTNHTKTVDSAHQPSIAKWWYVPRRKLAIIESAAVIGLAKLPPSKFHPFGLDTFGLGAVLRAAKSAGAKKCVIGIGGSATNDGGFGVARSLGWQFLDERGERVVQWPDLSRLSHVESPEEPLCFEDLVVAVDVQNPLLGRNGATRIYGPQKGLLDADLVTAEAALKGLARCVQMQRGADFSNLPGGGAAGGLGFGFAVFVNARLVPGFRLFAGITGLESRLSNLDVIVTGEGKLDQSSFMGKGSGEIARLAKRHRLPCICIAGVVESHLNMSPFFQRVLGLTELFPKTKTCGEPSVCLKHATALVAAEYAAKHLCLHTA
jgi:glycerate kinase